MGDGRDSTLTRPQLLGLQIQDPTLLPWDVAIWISAISPLLAGLKWVCFSSPSLSPALLQLHKIKSGPVYLVSRSTASFQLPTPGLFEANSQVGVVPPRTFLSKDRPAAKAGSESMNSFLISPSQTCGGEICQKKIAQLRSPAQEKRRLYYYLFLIICACFPHAGPPSVDDDDTAVPLAKFKRNGHSCLPDGIAPGSL